jgi:hypothetical protein
LAKWNGPSTVLSDVPYGLLLLIASIRIDTPIAPDSRMSSCRQSVRVPRGGQKPDGLEPFILRWLDVFHRRMKVAGDDRHHLRQRCC